MCKEDDERCVEGVQKVKFDSQCLPKCEGVLITSFDKQDFPADYRNMIKKEIYQYRAQQSRVGLGENISFREQFG